MDGVLLVNKEVGMSSYDVIRSIKRELGRKVKIGHAGTLDPFAQGLLIVLFGRATKLQDAIHEFSKVYEVKAEFGYETDTQDVTGEKTSTSGVPDKGEIEAVLPSFTGKISQIPPIYSALKVGGRKAYDLARAGEEVKLRPREVEIKKLKLVEYSEPFATFIVECSTGTYIRTLVVDIANALNLKATAVELNRSSIGPFNVEDALKISEISLERIERGIISIDKLSEYGLER